MLNDGRRAPASRQCTPTIIPACEAPEAEVGAGEVAGLEASEDFQYAFGENGSAEILMAEKMCLGWMCSYRTQQPEQRSFSAWRARWGKARARWSDVPLKEGRIRRAPLEQLALQEEWRSRRKAKKPVA